MARHAPDPDSELTFEYGDEQYTLVFDLKAVAFFERETGTPLPEALHSLSEAQRTRRSPKISHLAYMMLAGLQRHHPTVDEDIALAMIGNEAVLEALGGGLAEAMPSSDDADPDASAVGNAPKRPKAGAGTRSSAKPSKPRSRRKPSGG